MLKFFREHIIVFSITLTIELYVSSVLL